MPRYGVNWFLAVFCLLIANFSLFAQSKTGQDRTVDTALVIQNSLYQARQALAKGDTKNAVALLEANLHLINGNKDYLAALRDAYWAHAKELQRGNRDQELRAVLMRLRILDPTAELPIRPVATTATATVTTPQPTPAAESTGPASNATSDLVKNGIRAYTNRRYTDAARLFAQAHAADPKSLGEHRASWAYCRLHHIIERLNDREKSDPSEFAALEQDAAEALALAEGKPQLISFARQVQQRVRERRAGGVARGVSPEANAASDGWQAVESANFRVLYREKKELAERVLTVAEKTRSVQFEKWFGPPPAEWSPRCDIYIHPTASQYVQATHQPARSPGHSTVEVSNDKVIRRRLDLIGDHTNLLSSTTPHEVTHVVLADLFPNPLLPRWADEAMAILAEPQHQIDRYLQALPRCRQEGTLFSAGELLAMKEFPEAKRITAYYCQSVALVDMLVRMKDARTFAMFLQTAQRYGYDKALERTYSIRGASELQRKLQSRMN